MRAPVAVAVPVGVDEETGTVEIDNYSREPIRPTYQSSPTFATVTAKESL